MAYGSQPACQRVSMAVTAPYKQTPGNVQLCKPDLLSMQEEDEKSVPLEVQQHVKHDRRGILSMGRLDDPNSGGSSFSILLGPAPHLDMLYGIFG